MAPRLTMKPKPFECEFCRKKFADKYAWTRHTRTHTGEKPFECPHCDKSFSVNYKLSAHLLNHTGVKPYSCDFCGKTFVNKYGLTRHMWTHPGAGNDDPTSKPWTTTSKYAEEPDPISEKPYECSYCDKRFVDRYALTRHERTHTGEKPFQCNLCDKAFPVRYKLTQHMLKHN